MLAAARSKQAPSRKKACRSCAGAKVRCGLERPACARCVAAGRPCRYAADACGWPVQAGTSSADPAGTSSPVPAPAPAPGGIATPQSLTAQTDPASWPRAAPGSSRHPQRAALDLSRVDLVPFADADQIRDRWLRPFLAAPEQVPKDFDARTLLFAAAFLRAVPRHMAEGAAPPFIHAAQLAGDVPAALANCCSLVRLWQDRAPGSEAMVAETVRREMERLAQGDPGASHGDTLAAFQAYLVYAVTAYLLPLPGAPALVDDAAMVTLQELASRAARRGLETRAGASGARPGWASWVAAAAARRSVVTLCLLSNVYNATHGVPSFLADELRGIPAPEPKRLWEAPDAPAWAPAFDAHRARWPDGPLRLSELWRGPETGTPARRERVDRWVQTADEFGIMVFAVCVHLHGY